MGQDRGLWFPTQRFSSLSSQPLFHLGKQDLKLVSKTCGYTTDMFSAGGSYQIPTKFSQYYFDGSYGWVNGSPLLQHQFFPPQNQCMKQIPLLDSVMSKAEDQCSQKRFLVFDQSGDKTTLLLTSYIRESFKTLNQPTGSNMKEELQTTNKDLFVSQGNNKPDLQEDTEELNALLYSEDEGDDYSSEEDEVRSSGHSPSTIVSAHVEQGTFVESFGKPLHAEKRKTMPFLEPSCGSCDSTGNGSQKRLKPSINKISKEKIFEIVSLLRSIVVPGEELMDPILVIDRAIDYLKSLKMEAETRGHETLCLQDL